jgi:L-gulonate 3-dehydrogenase
VPLVEVIPSEWTVPEVTDRTMELLSSVGQVPVLVKKEVNGFVLNRIQYAIFAEAWRLIRVSGNCLVCFKQRAQAGRAIVYVFLTKL